MIGSLKELVSELVIKQNSYKWKDVDWEDEIVYISQALNIDIDEVLSAYYEAEGKYIKTQHGI